MVDQTVTVDGASLRVTNLDKVLYPASGTTKADVLSYYAHVAPVLLAHVTGRPLTRKRWPDGVQGQAFFHKNLPPGTPSFVRTVPIEHHGSTVTYPVAQNRVTVAWLAQIAALEMHVPQWRVDDNDHRLPPDRLVLDLDPGDGVDLPTVAHVARLVRQILDAAGLPSIPVTSGSKGLHLYASLDGRMSSDQASALAKELARALEADHRDLVISEMTRSARAGKVFLDWSQNNAAKTTIAPYSLRGTERPQVALPRSWGELDDPGLTQASPEEALALVAERGDPLTWIARS